MDVATPIKATGVESGEGVGVESDPEAERNAPNGAILQCRKPIVGDAMQFSSKRGFVSLSALLFVASFAVHADTRAEIEAVAVEMAAAANRGDSQAIAAMYTADAEIFDEGHGIVKGRAAIEKYFRDGLVDGFGNIQFKTFEVYPSGNYATEVGEYEWGDKSGKSLDHGYYIVVYRKEGGRWKLYRDSPTSSVPREK